MRFLNRMENKEKKVFGLLLESLQTMFLSIQYAENLEEAYALAKNEFSRMNPSLVKNGVPVSLAEAKIGLFTIKTMNELISNNIQINQNDNIVKNTISKNVIEELPIVKDLKELGEIFNSFSDSEKEKSEQNKKQKLTPEEEKNLLMKKIIDNKDKQLFKEKKSMFSKPECAYLKSFLK